MVKKAIVYTLVMMSTVGLQADTLLDDLADSGQPAQVNQYDVSPEILALAQQFNIDEGVLRAVCGSQYVDGKEYLKDQDALVEMYQRTYYNQQQMERVEKAYEKLANRLTRRTALGALAAGLMYDAASNAWNDFQNKNMQLLSLRSVRLLGETLASFFSVGSMLYDIAQSSQNDANVDEAQSATQEVHKIINLHEYAMQMHDLRELYERSSAESCLEGECPYAHDNEIHGNEAHDNEEEL